MKKLLIAIYITTALAIPSAAICGQLSRIELTDGNIINAEVVSFNNDTYVLNSPSLGQFQINASKIRKIEANNPIAQGAPDASSIELIKSKMDTLQTNITNDPAIMKIIAGLLTDPQFEEVLKDPEVVRAAKSKDINALVGNEKLLDLVNHPKVKEIENMLAK